MATLSKRIRDIEANINTLETFLRHALQNERADLERLKRCLDEEILDLENAQGRIGDCEELIDSLNTTDPELIKTESRRHEYSVCRWTPDFTFNLSTTFPIQQFRPEFDPSTSKWKTVSNFKGTTSFTAVLKNKTHTSAAATVRLYGDRREVFAHEIEACTDELARLRALEKQLLRSRNERQATLDRFRKGASSYASDEYLARSDLFTLSKIKPDTIRDISNPYSLASKIGLRSKVWRHHVVDVHMHEMLLSTAVGTISRCRMSWQQDYLRHIRAIQSSDHFQGLTVRNHTYALAYDNDSVENLKGDFLEESHKAVAAFSRELEVSDLSPAGRHVKKTSLQTLRDFGKETEELLRGCLGSLNEEKTIRAKSMSWSQFVEDVKTAEREAKTDARAIELLLGILEQEWWPIAVYLCFVGAKDADEGWKTVWEGIRMTLT